MDSKQLLTGHSRTILLALPRQADWYKWVFWLVFLQSYLIGRVTEVLTSGAYRTAPITASLILATLLLKPILINRKLLVATGALFVAITVSAVLNDSSLTQLIIFLRIPLIAYLVYNLVSRYLIRAERVQSILHYMYILGFVQLPVLLLQRFFYPYIPAQWKYSSLQSEVTLKDFGMGTLSGDTAMTFFLISLVILVLFTPWGQSLGKWRFPSAVWFTLSVFIGNSQMQHLTIIMVWGVYAITHIRPSTIILTSSTAIFLLFSIQQLNNMGLTTFDPIRHTSVRLATINLALTGEAQEEVFHSGNHDRAAAIQYYLSIPIKWFGDGPGKYLDSVRRVRTTGNWGHIFTFYAEVGLIGWGLSVLFLWLIAFPFSMTKKAVVMNLSWAQLLMFVAINVLSFVKYPMNTIPTIFTYCIVLVAIQMMSPEKTLKFAQ